MFSLTYKEMFKSIEYLTSCIYFYSVYILGILLTLYEKIL